MEFLFNFSALIQLISAVNFANIKFRFHKKIFNILFDVKNVYKKFSDIENAMNADIVSLDFMQPIDTKDNKSNKKEIEQLQKKYKDLFYEWRKEYNYVNDYIKKCINVKGIKSLFLFVSLYCVYDLALLAIISIKDITYYWSSFICNLNVFSIIIVLVYYTIIIFRKNNNQEDVHLYKRTLHLSFASILYSFFVSWLPLFGFGITISETQTMILSLVSIILPFYPCLFCVIYILINEYIVNSLVKKATAPLIQRQKSLHDDKVILDKMYVVFQTNNAQEDFSFD